MLKNRIIFFVITLFIVSCSTFQNDIDEKGTNLQTSFLVGGSFGGIVENNQLTEVDGTTSVDAISGATRKAVTLGVHTQFNISGHNIETGLEWLNFDQSIIYNLPTYFYYSRRDISFHQLRIPLVYNFELIKDRKLSLKIGASIGYTISKSIINSGTLPPYQFNDFDYGGTVGISYFPLKYVGIFCDIYRGSQIYRDTFHTAKGMGGQSYVKFGLIIRP
ncbi:MAG: outer membrane beta-barrel protein [Chlorobi bacterium]|nr:outer membrane beta-barrel protein [Chlorobiota bacterium]